MQGMFVSICCCSVGVFLGDFHVHLTSGTPGPRPIVWSRFNIILKTRWKITKKQHDFYSRLKTIDSSRRERHFWSCKTKKNSISSRREATFFWKVVFRLDGSSNPGSRGNGIIYCGSEPPLPQSTSCAGGVGWRWLADSLKLIQGLLAGQVPRPVTPELRFFAPLEHWLSPHPLRHRPPFLNPHMGKLKT